MTAATVAPMRDSYGTGRGFKETRRSRESTPSHLSHPADALVRANAVDRLPFCLSPFMSEQLAAEWFRHWCATVNFIRQAMKREYHLYPPPLRVDYC